jgi:hypothetical protein
MSAYSVDNDVVIHVYHIGSKGPAVGFQSRWTDTEHPGSNKKIQGWQWDKGIWVTLPRLDATGYAPSIWDPVSSFIDPIYWQSGTGENNE